MKETSLSFCSFDLTWLSMVRLAKGTTTTHPAFKFYQNEDGNFCLHCCRRSACLFCCCLGRCQSIVCITHPASVPHMMHGPSVMWLHFLLFLCEFIIACFVVVLDILVAGDLRHEYAQFTWGFLFRGPPVCLLCLSHLRCSDWCSFDDDCCRGMSIIVILTTSLQCLCCVCWQGRLVALRLIAMALLVTLEGRLSREHFGASQWWRQLHSLWSVMASILPIAIGNGVVACCCLLRLCLVPMLALCSQLGFLIV